MNSTRVRLNAWIEPSDLAGVTGGTVWGDVPDAAGWALRALRPLPPQFLAPMVSDARNWRDKEVGWGVVLRDSAAIPPALQKLIDARGKAPVFYYLPNTPIEYICLRNYAVSKDIAIEGAPTGLAADALPTYLLIYGTPEELPWRLQYVLNTTRCVGRVHLTGDALRHYVDALLKWDKEEQLDGGTDADPAHAVVWAVDKGEDDITRLMRDAIAKPLANKLATDAQLTVTFVDGESNAATVEALRSALAATHPGLIVTTSHGRTGPLDNASEMAKTIGQPVAADGSMVTASALLDGWQPAGAVWYAHACCSAGSDATSNFRGLFAEGTPAATVLEKVAGLGSRVAPLPTALLGADRPIRAFIGHVEPTFDWTLQLQATGQLLTSGLVEALYTRLYVEAGKAPVSPVGYAFRPWFGRMAGLEAQRRAVEAAFGRGEDVDQMLLATALAARDVESTVILGDPTVAVRGLGS